MYLNSFTLIHNVRRIIIFSDKRHFFLERAFTVKFNFEFSRSSFDFVPFLFPYRSRSLSNLNSNAINSKHSSNSQIGHLESDGEIYLTEIQIPEPKRKRGRSRSKDLILSRGRSDSNDNNSNATQSQDQKINRGRRLTKGSIPLSDHSSQ